nr:hypothetical protein BaRGS_029577 [Batillaria attramentaria]
MTGDKLEDYSGLEDQFHHLTGLHAKFNRAAQERLHYLDRESHLAGVIAYLMAQHKDKELLVPMCFSARDWWRLKEQSSIANTSIHVEGFLAEPHTVCQEREKYVNVFDCLSGATSKCFPRDKAAYFPNTTITADSINYLCQHVNTSESVMDCYIASYSKVYECAHKLADEELNKEQEEDIASTVCTFADITHDCIQVKVDCDDQARHTLLHFHDKYRTPPGCPSPSRQRRTYISTNGGVSLLLSQVSVVLITLLVSANFA